MTFIEKKTTKQNTLILSLVYFRRILTAQASASTRGCIATSDVHRFSNNSTSRRQLFLTYLWKMKIFRRFVWLWWTVGEKFNVAK